MEKFNDKITNDAELILSDKDLASKLIGGLKRLFTNKTTIIKVGDKKLKVVDTDGAKRVLANRGGRYDMIRSAFAGTNVDLTQGLFSIPRPSLYRLYLLMLRDPIISAALDVYADLCLTKNLFGLLITIKCDNVYKKKILLNLLYDILNILFNLWPWVRSLCKYGDFFLELKMSPKIGIIDYNLLSAYLILRVLRLEDPNAGTNNIEVVFNVNGARSALLKNYQVAHFRLLNDPNMYPYGKSILLGARLHWKKYTLLLDAVLIQRITRAPSKLVFNVDPGELEGQLALQYLNDMKAKMKKISYVDKNGNIDLRYNIMNMLEDYWILKNGDSGTSILTLTGLDYNAIDDVLMFRNNMLAGLKLPKAFLNFLLDVNSKSTLSSQYVRFASTVLHIQQVISALVKKICMVHLYLQGYRGALLIDFLINLNNSSNIKLMQLILLWNNRVDLATSMMLHKQFSRMFIYLNVYKMSKNLIRRLLKNIYKDAKFLAMLNKIALGGQSNLQSPYDDDLNSSFSNDLTLTNIDALIEDQMDVATDTLYDTLDPLNYKPQVL